MAKKKKNLMTPAVARDLAKTPPTPYRPECSPNPEVRTASFFPKDVGKMTHEEDAFGTLVPPESLEMRKLSPEKIARARKVVQGMVERYKKESKQEKTVQEAVKEVDIGPGKEIFTKQEAIIRGIMPPDGTIEPRYCPTHPKVPQRIDKLGRWMGMCTECLSARGKKCGEQNVERGNTAPPIFIPLNLARYSELKQWLIEQADQNERTLQKEIMMILKTAWRQGT